MWSFITYPIQGFTINPELKNDIALRHFFYYIELFKYTLFNRDHL